MEITVIFFHERHVCSGRKHYVQPSFLAAFNNFHNIICKTHQVQFFHKCRNTAYFDSCHFVYSFSICVCAPSFHIFFSISARPLLAMALLRHQCQPHKHSHTSGSELFEETDFSPPHDMPEEPPSLRMCGDHNHGVLRFCNT